MVDALYSTVAHLEERLSRQLDFEAVYLGYEMGEIKRELMLLKNGLIRVRDAAPESEQESSRRAA